MKKIFSFLSLYLISFFVYSQTKINTNDIGFDKTVYIFNATPSIHKCDITGTLIASDQYADVNAPANATFLVHAQLDATTYIISFKKWKPNGREVNLQNALIYNKFISAANFAANKSNIKSFMNDASNTKGFKTSIGTLDDVYFTISKTDLENSAFLYEPTPRVSFTYGTVSYLARLRPKVDTIPGRWSTDLSLGLAFGARYNCNKDNGVTVVASLGVTNVSVDSISTRGFVKNSVSHVAFTPCINLLYSYKFFSIGLAIGKDWINKDTEDAKEWIYNKKFFYGISLGVNVFRSSENPTPTVTQQRN